MAVTHYGLWRDNVPNSPMIKEASFFLEQKAQSRPGETWHAAWEPIEDCETIGQARRKMAEKYGHPLSHIYSDEK